MKRLTLLRHAKSSWHDPALPDHKRPLSGRGERDAAAMAERLRARGERPGLILTSHALRAAATARVFAAGLGCPDDAVRTVRSLYLASPETILAVVGMQDDSLEALMIVGHNPGLTELANHLLPELGLDKLPTAGAVAIAADVLRWQDVGSGTRRLLYYDYPKKAASGA